MSPFLTFAICLSIAYLLYYGANIGKDLYATGKQLTSNEEVFEIEDVPVETAVSVNEQGDGFFIGDAEPEETAEVLDPEKESEKKETAETERRIASLQENLDKADVVSEYGITAPELHELLEGKKNFAVQTRNQCHPKCIVRRLSAITYRCCAFFRHSPFPPNAAA